MPFNRNWFKSLSKKPADGGSQAGNLQKAKDAPVSNQRTRGTVLNALKFSVGALGTVGSNVPGLQGAVQLLLETVDRIQSIGDNDKGCIEFVEKITTIKSIILSMQENGVGEANDAVRGFLGSLKIQLEAMAVEIDNIKSDSGIAKFFNSNDNTAGIVKHNALLTQIISGLTLAVSADTHEKLEKVQKVLLEVQASLESAAANSTSAKEIKKIIAKAGGSGGEGTIGGAGAAGGPVKLKVARETKLNVERIESGGGGSGGKGIAGPGGAGGPGGPIDLEL